MSRRITLLSLLLAPALALAHGHPAAVDPAHPEAGKHRLCAEMTQVAIQAVHDRDKGRPPRRYADDGGPGSRMANAIAAKVHAEPAIRSPKLAEAYARSHCNDVLNPRDDEPAAQEDSAK